MQYNFTQHFRENPEYTDVYHHGLPNHITHMRATIIQPRITYISNYTH